LKQLTTIAGKDKDDTIVLCPTHKAAHRLLPKIPFGIEIKTIHSLLGWIPAINENAEKIEHIDIVAKTDRKIEEYNTFIIDEGGMMSEEMFMELVAKIEDARNFDTDGIKIYVYLDPYQLLPVKGRQIQLDEEFTTKLTTQHRAESPDVVALFTKFVEFLEGTNAKDLKIEFSDNVKKVSTTSLVYASNLSLFISNNCTASVVDTFFTLSGLTSNSSFELTSSIGVPIISLFIISTVFLISSTDTFSVNTIFLCST
jgi:hypothetical protein